jgi:recombination protein RecA
MTSIVEKSGAWYSYEGERIGQGRENAKKFLKENPDLFDAISLKVKAAMGIPVAAQDAPAAEDE